MCTLFDVNFQPAQMTVAELEEGFRELVRLLYCEEEVGRRQLELLRKLRTGFRASSTDRA